MSQSIADAWFTRFKGCDTVEKFEMFLAEEERFWNGAGGKSQEWESLKNFMLWFSFLAEKKIDHALLVLEQPGFDANAKFVCMCEGIQEGLKSIFKGNHQKRQKCVNSLCAAKVSPIHLPFRFIQSNGHQWSDGNFELLKKLLSVPGVDVNARGPGGMTPIEWAIGSYRVDALKLLAGVDKVDLEHTIDWVKTQFVGDPRTHTILKILEHARLARARFGLGKGRNARRRKNKEKQSRRNNEEKVEEKDKLVFILFGI